MTDNIIEKEKISKSKYNILIDDVVYKLTEETADGGQLLKLVKKDPQQHVIYQLLQSGEMEQLRPDEEVDLGKPGLEKFITFKTDRLYRFELNGHTLEWGAPLINGKTLKKLANVDPDEYVVVYQTKNGQNHLIDDKENIDLSNSGVEIFKTKPKLITVYYNHLPIEIEKGTYTTEQLIEIFNVTDGYILDLIVECEFIELKPGQTIKVRKGMTFVSHAPRGESS